jgi:hypothetical protein
LLPVLSAQKYMYGMYFHALVWHAATREGEYGTRGDLTRHKARVMGSVTSKTVMQVASGTGG